MTGKINQAFRRRLLKKFMQDTDIENVYLIFSLDSDRQLASNENTTTLPITAVHDGSSNISAKYAVRLDTNNKMQYAKEKEDGDSGTTISISGFDYIVSDTYSSTEFWTNAYFNTALADTDTDFNIVSIVINLDSTDEEITTFTNALFTDAEIVMMTKPATKNLQDIENNQFPGLIKF